MRRNFLVQEIIGFSRVIVADLDAHPVAGLQAEILAGDDAGAGHQQRAVREIQLAAQVGSQLGQGALHLGQAGLALEEHGALAHDFQPDGQGRQLRRRGASWMAGPRAHEPL